MRLLAGWHEFREVGQESLHGLSAFLRVELAVAVQVKALKPLQSALLHLAGFVGLRCIRLGFSLGKGGFAPSAALKRQRDKRRAFISRGLGR